MKPPTIFTYSHINISSSVGGGSGDGSRGGSSSGRSADCISAYIISHL